MGWGYFKNKKQAPDTSYPTVGGAAQGSTCCWTTTPGRTRLFCGTPSSGLISGPAWCRCPRPRLRPHPHPHPLLRRARRGGGGGGGGVLPLLPSSTFAEHAAAICRHSLPLCPMHTQCFTFITCFSPSQRTHNELSVAILRLIIYLLRLVYAYLMTSLFNETANL